jgi:hypothetical protein
MAQIAASALDPERQYADPVAAVDRDKCHCFRNRVCADPAVREFLDSRLS